MIRWFSLLVILSLLSVHAAPLQYLKRYTVASTAFDNATANSWAALDDDAIFVNIGFSFPFNGSAYTQLWINSNGMISFSSTNSEYRNQALPYTTEPQSIYPYWDDMTPPNGGTVRYETFGSDRFVITWSAVPHYSTYGSYTFELVLYANGDIRFRYANGSSADGTNCQAQAGCTESGTPKAGATIGVQESSLNFDQYSYDAAIDQTRDVLYRYIDNSYSDWHFDELSWSGVSGEIVDSQGANHGTAYSVSPVAGKICNAIDLSANSALDYAVLGSGALDRVGDFTASVWHRGDVGTDSNAILSGSNIPQYNEFIFWFSTSTRFAGYLDNGWKGNVALANINDGTWKHFVWRRAGEDLCFFLNGSLVGCQSGKEETILDVTSLILGQEQDSLGGGFDGNQDWEGVLDELLIFKRALSNSEISSIYNNQNSGNNWDGSVRTCPAVPNMSITKTSCVISDPVNLLVNPKRISGATIRYAIEVSNSGAGAATDTVVGGTLDSGLDYTTITNLQVQNGACGCIGVASASNNPPPGTADGVHPVKLNFATVAGGSIAVPTLECGYFEVDLK